MTGCTRPEATLHRTRLEIPLKLDPDLMLTVALYLVDAARPHAAVLVSPPGVGRDAWDILAARAQQAGLACAVIELPPPGEPRGRPSGDGKDGAGETTPTRLAAAIDGARRLLVERGANPHDIALIGAGSAANVVLTYAVSRLEIPAVVLLSPGLVEDGVNAEAAVAAYGNRASLIMTSENDGYAAASARAIKKAAPGFCELREYAGAAHGVDVLHASEQAVEQVLVWLAEVLNFRYPETDPPLHTVSETAGP